MKIRNIIPLALAILIASSASVLTYESLAHAQVVNPHPTPPNNSVTTGMLKDSIITPSKINIPNSFEFQNVTSTTTTTNTLTVNTSATLPGSLSINGTGYSFPASGGNTNDVLTEDGGGNLSWNSPASGKLSQNFTAGETIATGSPVSLGAFGTGTLGTMSGTGNTYSMGGSSNWLSQAITLPSTATSITSVTIWYTTNSTGQSGSTQTRVYLDGGSGVPTGASLGTASCGVTTGSGYFSCTTTFSPAVAVTGGGTYDIVAAGNIAFMTGVETGSASGQNTQASSDSGSSWSANIGPMNLTVTGTSGTAGQIYEASSANSGDFRFLGYIGIAEQGGVQGTTIPVDVEGLSTATSSLVIGDTYYLNDTNGTLGTSAGTNSKKVGKAVTTGILDVIQPPL